MEYPNRMRRAARTLAKEACTRLGLPKDEFRKWFDEDQNGFCNRCLSVDPLTPISRYSLIYAMVRTFILEDPLKFWDPVQATAAAPVSDRETEILGDSVFGHKVEKQMMKFGERPTIKWNAGQGRAFKSIFAWLKKSEGKKIYRMFGYAGTGKTSMAQEIAYTVENGEQGIRKGDVLFAAYTGKAASVLLSKGCKNAGTIHSLIYRPQIDSITGNVTGFVRNEESPLKTARLLICDEISMVDAEMAQDLLSFGVPILVLGDPFQLEPIKGLGYFTLDAPDTMLIDVERAAKENPLIALATMIRNKQLPKPGRYGESRVYAAGTQVTDQHIADATQIIVGMNVTRHHFNKRYRQIHGYFDIDSQFPSKGERLMCLKNNKLTGVLNGTQWHCSEPEHKPIQRLVDPKRPLRGYEATNLDGLYMRLRSIDMFDADGLPVVVNSIVSAHHFDETLPEPNWRDIAGSDAYTFAYAGTVHKLQGSQTDRALVYDQSSTFENQQWKHLYTAATRAIESLDLFYT